MLTAELCRVWKVWSPVRSCGAVFVLVDMSPSVRKQKRTRTFLIRVLRNNNLCRHFQALTNEAVRCDSGHTGAFFRKPLRMPYARSTLPERMHLVQTCIFLLPPAVFTAILWTFACQTLLDLLCEWLTWFPKKAPLPQISHLAILTPPNPFKFR